MKIPKYVEKALEQRAKYAYKVMECSSIIDKFIIRNGLQNEIPTEDYGSGVEVYENPYESIESVRQAILKH